MSCPPHRPPSGRHNKSTNYEAPFNRIFSELLYLVPWYLKLSGLNWYFAVVVHLTHHPVADKLDCESFGRKRNSLGRLYAHLHVNHCWFIIITDVTLELWSLEVTTFALMGIRRVAFHRLSLFGTSGLIVSHKTTF